MDACREPRVVGDAPATQTTRRTGHRRFVPLPHVAALIERAVGTGGQFEFADVRAIVRAANRVVVVPVEVS